MRLVLFDLSVCFVLLLICVVFSWMLGVCVLIWVSSCGSSVMWFVLVM